MQYVMLLCGIHIGPYSGFMMATETSGQHYMMYIYMYVPYLLLFAQGASIEVVSPAPG